MQVQHRETIKSEIRETLEFETLEVRKPRNPSPGDPNDNRLWFLIYRVPGANA